jgi:3-oxoadipate enol-lactonase
MTGFVTADDGARLAYRIDGDPIRPAILMINSLGTDHRMWDPQLVALVGRFSVIRYDARGHGQSEATPGPHGLERYGFDALAVLDHLGVARATICGLSLGGLTAQWLAVMHPERIAAAVFANTGAKIGADEFWAARIAAVETGGLAAIADAVLGRFFSAPFRARHPPVVEVFRRTLLAVPPAGYLAACKAIRDADLRGVVGRIRVPSLVIAGELDEATPPALGRELHEAVAGSRLQILPRAGHLSNVEQPGTFSDAVLSLPAPDPGVTGRT